MEFQFHSLSYLVYEMTRLEFLLGHASPAMEFGTSSRQFGVEQCTNIYDVYWTQNSILQVTTIFGIPLF